MDGRSTRTWDGDPTHGREPPPTRASSGGRFRALVPSPVTPRTALEG